MVRLIVLVIFLYYAGVVAQTDSTRTNLDPRYLEDQFYIGLTYNFLLNKPPQVNQRNLSYGLMTGFIKDFPFNARRNLAFGIGLGYAINAYYTNLAVTPSGDSFLYTPLTDNNSYKRNKVETHMLEVPIEFRWRNSTAAEYRFWRIYTGVKLGYVVGGRSKLVGNSDKNSFYNADITNFHYGLIMNFGFNTFNVHAYYALNDLFESGTATVTGDPVGFTPLRIGIIFYIL
jgi:hypothetical protein